MDNSGAANQTRTGTLLDSHWILSPGCLPIPSLRHRGASLTKNTTHNGGDTGGIQKKGCYVYLLLTSLHLLCSPPHK